MRDAPRSDRGGAVIRAWRVLGSEQRVAAVGAVLLFVSTFGPFSFVELAEMLIAVGVLFLLWNRVEGREFHLPFGDGTVIAAAGIWSGVLIAIRLFDRPFGQGLLSLACAALLFVAGTRERAKRPPDDLPTEQLPRSDLDLGRPDAQRQPHRGEPGDRGGDLEAGG